MILVVCPNLAIDVTLEVDELVAGGVHRAADARRQAGGKGVNTARALLGLDESALVLGFGSERNGGSIARGLEAERIPHQLVPIEGENRTCTIVLTRDGTATVVNERGPDVTASEVAALEESFDELLEQAGAVALMGSLPPGADVELYRRMTRACRERQRPCLVDTSGPALAAALGAHPHIVKPNRHEAEALLDATFETAADEREALDALRARGADIAFVTDGRHGVFFGDGERYGRARVETKTLTLGNPTGAGDSFAAGLLAAWTRGHDLETMARLGVAAATASLAEGYGRIRAKDIRIEAVSVEDL